jgi:hypothetical protein
MDGQISRALRVEDGVSQSEDRSQLQAGRPPHIATRRDDVHEVGLGDQPHGPGLDLRIRLGCQIALEAHELRLEVLNERIRRSKNLDIRAFLKVPCRLQDLVIVLSKTTDNGYGLRAKG